MGGKQAKLSLFRPLWLRQTKGIFLCLAGIWIQNYHFGGANLVFILDPGDSFPKLPLFQWLGFFLLLLFDILLSKLDPLYSYSKQ